MEVRKPGYYFLDRGSNQGFQFANPDHTYYYIPDASKPAVFRLRKKLPGVPVASRELETSVDPDNPLVKVNLVRGYFKPDGTLTITVNKPREEISNQVKVPWSMTMTMAEGGLVETKDLYPVLAPAEGYAPNVTIDMTNTNAPS